MAFIAGQRVRHGHFVDAKGVVYCTQNVFNNGNDITSTISTSKQQRISPRTLAPTQVSSPHSTARLLLLLLPN